MSDEGFGFDDINDQDGAEFEPPDHSDERIPNPLRSVVRRLEAEKKQLQEQLQASTTEVREARFVRAGIDPDNPKARYFVDGYQGKLDVDEIRREAQATGFLSRTVATPAEQQGMSRFDEAASGGHAPEVAATLTEKVRSAKSEQELLATLAMAQQQANPY